MNFKDMRNVVVKKNSKWFRGSVNNYIFTSTSEIKGLKDVDNVSSYIPLGEYMKKNNSGILTKDLILKKLDVELIYISEEPFTTKKEFGKSWWKEKNTICISCIKTCKQSSRASVISCSEFKSIGNE